MTHLSTIFRFCSPCIFTSRNLVSQDHPTVALQLVGMTRLSSLILNDARQYVLGFTRQAACPTTTQEVQDRPCLRDLSSSQGQM